MSVLLAARFGPKKVSFILDLVLAFGLTPLGGPIFIVVGGGLSLSTDSLLSLLLPVSSLAFTLALLQSSLPLDLALGTGGNLLSLGSGLMGFASDGLEAFAVVLGFSLTSSFVEVRAMGFTGSVRGNNLFPI